MPIHYAPGPLPFRVASCLRRSGMGFGSLALAPLLAGVGRLRPREVAKSARAQGGPLSGQGQARHPPVHERRAVARRHVRSQAGADEVRRPRAADANLPTERKTGAALPSPFKFQQVRPERHRSQRAVPARRPNASTTSASSARCTPTSPNHEPSLLLMNCGEARLIRPSMGSWLTYGLGTENQNLPGFIAMCPGGYPIQESQNWQAGFLPGVYQGTYIDTQAHRYRQADRAHRQSTGRARRPAATARPAAATEPAAHATARQPMPSWKSRIQSFELAYRMQIEAGRRVRRQPRAAAHPRHVRPRHAGPANA